MRIAPEMSPRDNPRGRPHARPERAEALQTRPSCVSRFGCCSTNMDVVTPSRYRPAPAERPGRCRHLPGRFSPAGDAGIGCRLRFHQVDQTVPAAQRNLVGPLDRLDRHSSSVHRAGTDPARPPWADPPPHRGHPSRQRETPNRRHHHRDQPALVPAAAQDERTRSRTWQPGFFVASLNDDESPAARASIVFDEVPPGVPVASGSSAGRSSSPLRSLRFSVDTETPSICAAPRTLTYSAPSPRSEAVVPSAAPKS